MNGAMYGDHYKPDHGKLDYVAMGFGMVAFLGVWLFLNGLPETPAGWWLHFGVLGTGIIGLMVCLAIKKRWT